MDTLAMLKNFALCKNLWALWGQREVTIAIQLLYLPLFQGFILFRNCSHGYGRIEAIFDLDR